MERNKNSKSLLRAGSAPRTISFSNSNTVRKFDHQNPSLNNKDYIRTEIPINTRNNTFNKESVPTQEDCLKLRKVTLLERSNTNRCLIPNLAPESSEIKRKLITNNQSANFYPPGNLNCLMSKTGKETSITNCRKTTNPRMYRSFSLSHETNQTPNQPSRSGIKIGDYMKYTTTTQIENLPGGVKRDPKEIKDNANESIKRNYSFNVKLSNDYQSKVSCLPGNVKNMSREKDFGKQKQIFRTEFNKDYAMNDYVERTVKTESSRVNYNIITNQSNTKVENSFKVSNKKREYNTNTFGNSNNEKKLIENPKSRRPVYIKNPFESQITIC